MYIPEWFTGWPLWCPPPHIWMTKNHFRSHLSPFQINAQLKFFLKFVSENGCWWPFWMTKNITFDRISLHFRSIRNLFSQNGNMQLLLILFCSQYGCRWPFWMTENHFRSHSRHFRSIRNFFFTK